MGQAHARAADRRSFIATEPRSAHEELGGVRILARVIDKGRAYLSGTLGRYCFFECALDRVFFEAVKASKDEFLDMLSETYASFLSYNAAALADLREALASEPEVSDKQFLAFAEVADADNAAVNWLLHEKSTPPSVLAAINAAVERLPASTFVDWV